MSGKLGATREREREMSLTSAHIPTGEAVHSRQSRGRERQARWGPSLAPFGAREGLGLGAPPDLQPVLGSGCMARVPSRIKIFMSSRIENKALRM
jgi:hypothetical protein